MKIPAAFQKQVLRIKVLVHKKLLRYLLVAQPKSTVGVKEESLVK